jgi:excinuclease ABC subunit A
MLKDMTRRKNTVVVVEHDIDVIRAADRLIDMGPGAGTDGGRIMAEGSPEEVAACPSSPTGRYLAGKQSFPAPLAGAPRPGIRIVGARANNLRSVDVDIPAGVLTAVTGVSGSGKSSLVFDVLAASAGAGRPVGCGEISGLERFERVVHVDQEPLDGGSRSIPATYTGLFDPIRGLFAETAGAKARGFGKAHFSFLTREGRCETCGGAGKTTVSMDFLADVDTECEDCGGKRYKPEVLEIRLEGKSVAEVLDMTMSEARAFFAGRRALEGPLALFDEIGLGYVRLGQPLNTLSGGEAQRLKLTAGLAHPVKGESLYIFDEPTTGLHFTDIEKLIRILARLLAAGHTVIVVEHNMNVIARAHRVIDLGPEGGGAGGCVVAAGRPAEIAACPGSYTGAALRRYFPSSAR